MHKDSSLDVSKFANTVVNAAEVLECITLFLSSQDLVRMLYVAPLVSRCMIEQRLAHYRSLIGKINRDYQINLSLSDCEKILRAMLKESISYKKLLFVHINLKYINNLLDQLTHKSSLAQDYTRIHKHLMALPENFRKAPDDERHSILAQLEKHMRLSGLLCFLAQLASSTRPAQYLATLITQKVKLCFMVIYAQQYITAVAKLTDYCALQREVLGANLELKALFARDLWLFKPAAPKKQQLRWSKESLSLDDFECFMENLARYPDAINHLLLHIVPLLLIDPDLFLKLQTNSLFCGAEGLCSVLEFWGISDDLSLERAILHYDTDYLSCLFVGDNKACTVGEFVAALLLLDYRHRVNALFGFMDERAKIQGLFVGPNRVCSFSAIAHLLLMYADNSGGVSVQACAQLLFNVNKLYVLFVGIDHDRICTFAQFSELLSRHWLMVPAVIPHLDNLLSLCQGPNPACTFVQLVELIDGDPQMAFVILHDIDRFKNLVGDGRRFTIAEFMVEVAGDWCKAHELLYWEPSNEVANTLRHMVKCSIM